MYISRRLIGPSKLEGDPAERRGRFLGVYIYIGSILLPVTVDDDGAWLQALFKNRFGQTLYRTY